jgi:hypothetical protein
MATAAQPVIAALPKPLAGQYASPPAPHELNPTPATVRLVRSQVRALLATAPSYTALDSEEQSKLEDNLVRVAAYAAECVRELCWQSERLGQTPVVRQRVAAPAPLAVAQAAGDDFKPAAANQIARVTEQTLKAIAFPRFVADLIRGTFNAIVQTSIQQMEAFGQMIANVSKTVDEFMQDNISDYQARDWLAQTFPEHIRVHNGKAVVRPGADDKEPPNFQRNLNLPDDVSLDDDAIEDSLVPAARRRLAEMRLQMLSTLVLMGVNRIIITGGKIRATMGFHIDTTDRAHEEQASDFDFRTGAAGSFGFGPWQASASMSISYVRSTRKDSDSELNVDADLTGEVEIHFKSDYFPLERFATPGSVGRIQANTANPSANSLANPLGGAPEPGGTIGKYTSPRSRRSEKRKPTLRKIGESLPDVKRPTKPDAPEVPEKKAEDDKAEDKKQETKPAPDAAKKNGGAKGDDTKNDDAKTGGLENGDSENTQAETQGFAQWAAPQPAIDAVLGEVS